MTFEVEVGSIPAALAALRAAHKQIEAVGPETNFQETFAHIRDAIALVNGAAMHLQHAYNTTVAEAICEIGTDYALRMKTPEGV